MSSRNLRSSKTILDVPFRKQILANSCFPSCVRMVLKFYGDDIDEKWLCKNSTLPGHKGCWDVKIGPILIRKGYKVTSFWDGSIEDWNSDNELIKAHRKEYKRAAKQGLKHKKNATIYLIKKFIDNKTPVLTEVSSDKLYKEHFGYTHMIVIIGYDKSSFYFHDPDKIHGGKNKKVSFGRFRKCWEKISSDSGRSMIVIEKDKFRRLEDIIVKYKKLDLDSNFSDKVYKAVSKIPKGKVSTYKEVAKTIGKPNAVRAVGQCLKANKHLEKILCYKILRSDGSLCGYCGGDPKTSGRKSGCLKRTG